MGFFKRAWKGEEKLWKVWWLFGVPLNIVSKILQKMSEMAPPPIPIQVIWLLLLCAFVLWVYWCIAVWRCAPNVETKSWTYVARALVVVSILLAIFAFIGGLTGVIR